MNNHAMAIAGAITRQPLEPLGDGHHPTRSLHHQRTRSVTIALSVEARFGATQTSRRIEWLTDNGGPYTAHETRAFASASGLIPRNTPESNGMAEGFVKTIKRDFVYLADLRDAATVLRLLPTWIDDYNENQPHKGLKMLSPRQFRRLHTN